LSNKLISTFSVILR